MSKAFELWLDDAADRERGVALDIGMPEHPVTVWMGGSWDAHPNGYQSAQVRQYGLEAIRCYYLLCVQQPSEGETIVTYYDYGDKVVATTYEYRGDDSFGDTDWDNWGEIAEEIIDLRGYMPD